MIEEKEAARRVAAEKLQSARLDGSGKRRDSLARRAEERRQAESQARRELMLALVKEDDDKEEKEQEAKDSTSTQELNAVKAAEADVLEEQQKAALRIQCRVRGKQARAEK